MRFRALCNDVLGLGDRYYTGIGPGATTATDGYANANTARTAGRDIAGRRPTAITAAAADGLGRDTVGAVAKCLHHFGGVYRDIIRVRAGTRSTTQRHIDRAARRTADTERAGEGEAAITAATADGLRKNTVRNVAERVDSAIRCYQHISDDYTTRAAIAAQGNTNTNARRAADGNATGGGPAAITAAAANRLGE